MIRVALTEVALFLAPFALYALWMIVSRRRPQIVPRDAAGFWRLFSLMMIGVLLAIGFLLLFGEERAAPPGSRYVPPHMENGRYVPGRFMPGDKP